MEFRVFCPLKRKFIVFIQGQGLFKDLKKNIKKIYKEIFSDEIKIKSIKKKENNELFEIPFSYDSLPIDHLFHDLQEIHINYNERETEKETETINFGKKLCKSNQSKRYEPLFNDSNLVELLLQNIQLLQKVSPLKPTQKEHNPRKRKVVRSIEKNSILQLINGTEKNEQKAKEKQEKDCGDEEGREKSESESGSENGSGSESDSDNEQSKLNLFDDQALEIVRGEEESENKTESEKSNEEIAEEVIEEAMGDTVEDNSEGEANNKDLDGFVVQEEGEDEDEDEEEEEEEGEGEDGNGNILLEINEKEEITTTNNTKRKRKIFQPNEEKSAITSKDPITTPHQKGKEHLSKRNNKSKSKSKHKKSKKKSKHRKSKHKKSKKKHKHKKKKH
ncbi:hypothetical protein M0813_00826 [Anaeramoeba flamelloides]|uniref:Uncharacterized protein n=1 Tax=Anaeramoeba flamelloides TaxID=1746091 RepID=A0ABQ8XEC8_9EUKA|nr:hypothetical protein M0813_00826 [Anaeramoeba flamelloides]